MKFNPKKSLGQNFLTDKNIIKKIVNTGKITKDDKILEIGPGTGNLTEYIINSNPKCITVVEKDVELIKILNGKFKNKIKIINDDVLKLNENFYNDRYIIYGNLPYNISTKILSNWCLSKNIKFKKLILMFQKEVAERIIAKVNTKNYSRISILANWKFDIKKIFDVSPECFFPKPKVMSSLLLFKPKINYIKFKNSKNLEYITNVFFNQRRKMIKKPLNILFKNTKEVIKELDLDINLRPQNLKKDTFYKICLIYEKLIK